MDMPPRDSASITQGEMVARPLEDLATTLIDLVQRVREELAYNAAKGSGPYRQGMHDGLRFAEDALVAIVDRHGGKENLPDSPSSATLMDV